MSFCSYKFEIKPLPYDYNALEPYIDTKTMHLHHDKHLQTYIDKLNKALENYQGYHNWSLEKLVRDYEKMPLNLQMAIRNNAGGVYNHNLYFESLGTTFHGKPLKELMSQIKKDFGSYDDFKTEFKNNALDRFGSGYSWLVKDDKKNLKILSTANQDTPLRFGLCPILLIDVWEHSYYLKFHNRRDEYIESLFSVIDWEKVEQRYLED